MTDQSPFPIDDVRGRLWDLGVKVARDSGAPDHIYRRPSGSSVYIRDRDGNEIELVEPAVRSPLSHAAADRIGRALGR